VADNEGAACVKTVVCFGDSNTWGFDPETKERFPHDVRWTGVLAKTLGDGYRVIEEGLNGRTTVVDDPISPYRNGRDYIIPCLESHKPFDLVTIMLGTNDLKERFKRSASDIAESAAKLAEMALNSTFGPNDGRPRVLLIAPPPVVKLSELAEMFEGSIEKSKRFAEHFKNMAEWYDCAFFDAGSVITSSELDGIHFEASEHQKLGIAIAGVVRSLIG
jgi:lysophospholipase L1-like esterase